ncbi:MAG: rhomboid family intramembrane serine protease [Patescibacteria group bacterium]|nr:rhomboid family intramembrane serine protease [Patescibacteria group bacterium]
MLPLRDINRTRSFPLINYLIIFANILVFIRQLASPDFEEFIYQYGFIPAQFNFLELSSYQFIFYSIFLHGSLFHIASNLWFLHIFGDNVEDRLGHLKYLVFYLLAGCFSVLFQYSFNPGSEIPMIGASGAISGVTGAYFVLFNRSKIEALVPFFGFFQIIYLPAWFFLGYWFLIQLFSGVGSLVTFDINQGGIAWFAHIGGFIFGFWTVANFLKK